MCVIVYCINRKLTASTSDHDKRITRHTSSSDQPSCSNHMEVTPSLNDVVYNKTTMNSVVSQSLLVEQPCPLQQVTGSSMHHLNGGDNVTVTVTDGVTDADMTSRPSSSLQQAHSSNMLPTEGRTSEQDVLSSAVFTSPSPTCVSDHAPCVSDHKVEVTHRICVDDPLEDESPTPVNIPVCSSTPDKSHTTLRMSRSPSIPLQNVSVGNHPCYKVDVTPVVLPKRMIALEGLYQADSPELDHDHDSLDMFDDLAPSVPSNQQVNDDLDMTTTFVTNPINNDQNGVIDSITPCNQPVKDNLGDSLVPNKEPGKDNQHCIDLIVGTAPSVPSNQPVNQESIDMIVDTAPNYQPVKGNQDSQFIDAVPHNKLVSDNQDGLDLFDDEVPAAPSKQWIKADQNGVDKTSTVRPTNQPVKDDQNIDVISPALFTPDQASLPHGHNNSPMDTLSSSPALGDSISTQVSCLSHL